MKTRFFRRAAQKGFTLIELAIVAIFLGLLAIFAVTQFSGSATDSTKAQGLYDASDKLASNWSLVSMQCGTTTDVTSASSLGKSAADNLSMLLGTKTISTNAASGTNINVTAAMVSCYTSSGIRALAGLAQGAAGSETVYGYSLALSAPTTTSMGVKFAAVPKNIADILTAKYSSNVSWNSTTGDLTITRQL